MDDTKNMAAKKNMDTMKDRRHDTKNRDESKDRTQEEHRKDNIKRNIYALN